MIKGGIGPRGISRQALPIGRTCDDSRTPPHHGQCTTKQGREGLAAARLLRGPHKELQLLAQELPPRQPAAIIRESSRAGPLPLCSSTRRALIRPGRRADHPLVLGLLVLDVGGLQKLRADRDRQQGVAGCGDRKRGDANW